MSVFRPHHGLSAVLGQELRWQKEHKGLLMHATDLYKPEINYNQLLADKEAIQNSEDDTDSEDIPLWTIILLIHLWTIIH